MNRSLKQSFTPFWLPAAFTLAVYLALRSLYWQLLPVWDAREYYQMLVNSLQPPYALLHAPHGGDHNALGWFALAGIAELLFPRDYVAFNLWLSAISGFSIVCLYYLLRHLAGGRMGPWESAFATLLIALHPTIFSNMIRFTPDMGIFVFMPCYALALLKGRRWWAALAGCFLISSKEPAMACVPLLFAFCAMLQPDRTLWAKRNLPALAIPFGLMGLQLLRKLFLSQILFFDNKQYLFISPLHPSFLNYVLMAFVLNGNWLLTLLMAVMAWRLKTMPAAYRGQGGAYALLLLGGAAIVLSIRHWANTRYLLPFYFTYMISFVYLLGVWHPAARRLLLSALLALMLAQNVRTLDPVSKAVFCTTQWGSHEILYIPTMEYCFLKADRKRPLNRDQLVYNLEFTHLTALTGRLRDLPLLAGSPIAVQTKYDDALVTRPIASDEAVYLIPATTLEALAALPEAQLPDNFYYLAFPLPQPEIWPARLSGRYRATQSILLADDGYELVLTRYTRQPE